MGIYRAVLAIIVIVPHFLQNFLAGKGNALVVDQKHQQVKLFWGQRGFLPGHLNAVAGGVDHQIPKGIHITLGNRGGHGAGQYGLHAGNQLPRAERLYHIVIRAALQPGQFVIFFAAGGQHDHRCHDLAGAHLAQAGHAIHKRHHNIKDHQVNAAVCQLGQRLCAVPGFGTGKTRVLQVLADQIPNARFIVNDQYSCHF